MSESDADGLQPEKAQEREPPAHPLSRCVRILFVCLAAITLFGVLVRYTVHDQIWGLSVFFYATPLPVLAGGTFLCLLRSVSLKRIGTGLAWGLLLTFLLTAWFQQDWKSYRTEKTFVGPATNDLSLLFWNVARHDDLKSTVEVIRELHPDVVGLVEVGGDIQGWRQFWKDRLPEYDVTIVGGQMLVMAKGTSGETVVHNLTGGSHARQLEVRVRGISYQILIVDIHANPLASRERPLAKLTRIAASLSSDRLVIMGDFNTPTDSVWFRPLRREHTHLFEAVGSGYAATWPVPVPVLQLDQIWINENVLPLRCRHGWSWASDHRYVEARIRPRR